MFHLDSWHCCVFSHLTKRRKLCVCFSSVFCFLRSKWESQRRQAWKESDPPSTYLPPFITLLLAIVWWILWLIVERNAYFFFPSSFPYPSENPYSLYSEFISCLGALKPRLRYWLLVITYYILYWWICNGENAKNTYQMIIHAFVAKECKCYLVCS